MAALAPPLLQIRLEGSQWARATLAPLRLGKGVGLDILLDSVPALAQFLRDGADAISRGVEPSHLFEERVAPRAARRAVALGAGGRLGRRSGRGSRLLRGRRRGGFRHRWSRRHGRFLQHLLFPRERPLQRRGQVLEEVETVRDLNGVGSSLAGSLRVGTAAVAGDDLDAGMLPQPLGQGLGPAVGEQVDDAAALEVHQDRPILLAFPFGPIVHPEHPGHDRLGGRDLL